MNTELPKKASDFIRIHYPQSIVRHVKKLRNHRGKVRYHVCIFRDELASDLQFDHLGNLVTETNTPLYPEDYYEGGFYGEERWD